MNELDFSRKEGLGELGLPRTFGSREEAVDDVPDWSLSSDSASFRPRRDIVKDN